MAIKIIPSTIQCPYCFTTVEYEASDVQRIDYYVDSNNHYHNAHIECPHCGEEIILAEY